MGIVKRNKTATQRQQRGDQDHEKDRHPMTTKYREGEAEAWDRLATETEPDGPPKFPKAKSNAQFWRDMEEQLNIIRGKLEG